MERVEIRKLSVEANKYSTVGENTKDPISLLLRFVVKSSVVVYPQMLNRL